MLKHVLLKEGISLLMVLCLMFIFFQPLDQIGGYVQPVPSSGQANGGDSSPPPAYGAGEVGMMTQGTAPPMEKIIRSSALRFNHSYVDQFYMTTN